jgi:hypothetical protein
MTLSDLPIGLLERVVLASAPDGDARSAFSLVCACGKQTARQCLAEPRFMAAIAAAAGCRFNLASVIEARAWSDEEAAACVAHVLALLSDGAGHPAPQACVSSVLAHACRRDMVQTMRAALSAVRFAHVPYATLDQMLVTACDAGAARCVRALLDEYHADVQYAQGLALWRAVLREQSEHGEVTRALLSRGALPRLALAHAVCMQGQGEAVRILLSMMPDAVVMHAAPQLMWLACSVGNLRAVTLLLESDSAWNREHSNALVSAAANGHADIVDVLLARGADVNASNGRALRAASSWGRYDVVKRLLDAGADAHALEDRALLDACTMGHFDVAGLILDHCRGHARERWSEGTLFMAIRWAAAHGQDDVTARLTGVVGEPPNDVAPESHLTF